MKLELGSHRLLGVVVSFVLFGACIGHDGNGPEEIEVARKALIDPATILVDTGTDVGATGGGISVGFDGAASYTVPLWTPESVSKGTQPALSLRYSSAAAGGMVAHGWDVTGFSRISRCNQGGALTETPRKVAFDPSDILCLDGQRLTHLPGESSGAASGMTGAVYHTEPDRMARITITGHDSLGPTSFEVRTADGLIHTYAQPVEAMRQSFSTVATSATAPVFTSYTRARLSWVLRRTQDRFGNVMLVSWSSQPVANGVAQEAVPVQIDYGGQANELLRRQVVFHYVTRPAETWRTFFTSGFLTQQAVRLQSIEMRGPNPTATDTVRWYELGYGAPSATQRQLLRTLQECDGPPGRAGRACKQPTTFSYETGLATFTKVTTSINDLRPSGSANEKFWRLMVADLNGDGRDDVLYRNGRDWKYSLSKCAGNLTGCGFNAGTTLNIASTLRGGSSARAFDPVIADLDLDGVPDLAGINPNTPNRYLFFRGALGSGGNSVSFALDRTEPAGAEATSAIWVVAPFGKFRPSIFRPMTGGGWGQWSDYFQQYLPLAIQGDEQLVWQDSDPTRAWNSYAADIDGDGAPDMMGNATLHGQTGLKRLVVASQAFEQGELTTLPISEPDVATRKYLFADFNGDGLPEAVQLASGMSGPRIAQNTGNGFGEAVLQALPSDANIQMSASAQWLHLGDPGIRVLDYDGDGRDDLLLVDDGRVRGPSSSSSTRSKMKVLLSRNGGFVKQDVPIDIGQAANGADSLPSGAASNWLLTQVLDVNGDGLKDIALSRNGVLELQIRNGKLPDMLIGVRDGMGLKRTINYKPLSDRGVHTPVASGLCAYPQGCPDNGNWVVASHLADNGNGTGQNQTDYTYTGRRVDLENKTVLGFESVVEKRPGHVSGQTRTVEYKFDFSLQDELNIGPNRVRIHRSLGRPTQIEETIQLAGGRSHKVVTTPRSQVVTSHGGATYFVHDTETTVVETNDQGQARQVTISTPLQPEDADFGVVRTVTKEIRDLTNNTVVQTDVWTRDYFRPQNAADRQAWLIGLPRTLQWTSSTPTQWPRTRRLDFEIDNMANLAASTGAVADVYVERETGDWDMYLHTHYDYNHRGQVRGVTYQDLDPATPDRSTTITYAADGVHAEFVNNGLHDTQFVTHPGLGVVGEVIDPNGLSTVMRYDRFGRPRSVQPTAGDGVTWAYARTLESGSPGATDPNARFTTTITETRQTGGIAKFVRNRLNREIRRESRLMDGAMAFQLATYDNLGLLKTFTRPATGSTAGAVTTYVYDNLGRTTEVFQPQDSDSGGRRTVLTYTGRQTTVTEGVQTTTYLSDAADRIVSSSSGASVTYEYGPWGLLLSLTRKAGPSAPEIVTWMDYDLRGRQIYMLDPDAKGRSTYYTAFGDVRATQTDDAFASYEYDQLGREIHRWTKDGYRGTGWDSGAGAGIGKVHYTYAETTFDDYVFRVYSYDGNGALTDSDLYRQRPDGSYTGYNVGISYDGFGRPTHIRYPHHADPARIEVRNEFDPESGELAKVVDTRAGGATYWQLEATGPDGQITRERQGNGFLTTRAYYPNSGRLRSVTGATTSTHQGLSYKYNAGDGNLRVRSNSVTGMHERFEYDALDRIRRWVRATDASGAEMSNGWKVNYTIDNLGNLLRRESIPGSGGGSTQNAMFEYSQTGNAGPHAVTWSSLYGSYEYDLEGNQAVRPGGETISYTAEELPKVITGPRAASFAYDAYGVRVEKRDDITGDLTTYVDGLFEARKAGANTDYLHHIYGPEGVVAEVMVPTSNGVVGTQRTRYIHTDHLGSVELVTCGTGEASATCPSFVAERRAYDPFGNNLTGTTNKHLPVGQADLFPASKVSVGFTGHEQDFGQGLINMRGREYDPRVGRFLTTDPIVQAPFNPQSLNRYAYVFNNPLKYIDPTGFFGDCSPSSDDYWCQEERKKCEQAGGCGLDWDVIRDLEAQGCQVQVNGSGYIVVPGTCGGGGTGGGGNGGGDGGNGGMTGQCPDGSAPTVSSSGAQYCGGSNPTPTPTPEPTPAPIRIGGTGGGSGGGFWDKAQLTLDVISMGADVTGVGAAVSWVPDLLNAGISLARGDFKGAALSAAGAIPVIGNAFNAARLARGAGKVIDLAGASGSASRVARIVPGSLPAVEEAAVVQTLRHIDAGTKPAGDLGKKWGTKFKNRDGDLPGAQGVNSPYREFRVAPSPGMSGAGTNRVVVNSQTGDAYYTWTHYGDTGNPPFVQIR